MQGTARAFPIYQDKKHKILFDLGQDGTFIKNARKLGVDIADINTGYFAAEKLSERHRELNFIMISDSEQYAVDAFRLHVSDFWLYPYTAERVEEAFPPFEAHSRKGITVKY